MLEYDFEGSVTFWIWMTSHVFEQALNDELARHGITFRQMQVLGWLSLEGELTQTQLAERMRIEAPTLAGILERMERDQWIRRENPPEDRRKKIVRPAPRVKPVWERIVKAVARVRERAIAGLSEQEIDVLKSTLQKIQQNIKNEADSPLTRREKGKSVAEVV